MSISTTTLTPSIRANPLVLGVGAVAEHTATQDHLDRATAPDYRQWLSHVMPAAACANPIRLRVEAHWHDTAGRTVDIDHVSDTMPDGLLYVACKNRRTSVCPGCAATYRADMYHLIKAGMLGGKGVPDTVTTHPCLFITFTAPSFGPVHTASKPGKFRPCTPRRNATRCPHGVVLACWLTHSPDDPHTGQPLCRDCYDYDHQAVWNLHAGELWRRTTISINRNLAAHAKQLGVRVRLQYAKVAEYQHRGAVHFHALFRLDGYDPNDKNAILPPNPGITVEHLRSYIDSAVRTTTFMTASHPRNRDGWPIAWGEQLDIRTVHLDLSDVDDSGQLTNAAVAGYLAKYATKASEVTGHMSKRLTAMSIQLCDRDTHQNRQLQACWYLGERPLHMTGVHQRQRWNETWGKLQRWAHMLGFGGHFATKSRRYSTTLTALRNVRRAYQLGQQPEEFQPLKDVARDHDVDSDEAELVVIHTFDGVGWLTTADAQLANTAAAKAREYRLTAREEIETQLAERR